MNEPGDLHTAHLPEPSFWPITLAFGMVLIAIGIIFSLIISAVGVVVLLAAMVGWTLENRPGLLPEEGDEPHVER